MLLEHIHLKDFRCFHGDQTISFSTVPEQNVTLIHAENGVGKTTLLNAMLWCFYGMTTPKFERRHDLVNYDALKEGRTSAFVEVTLTHNGSRYRARRYATADGNGGDRSFSIMRLDTGHSGPLTNPDTFINTVIPKGMASHFLFDGEHAEVFLGEENRSSIRGAVQDILGCTLIDTAIKDLNEAANYYRRQLPKAKASADVQRLNSRVEALTEQIAQAKELRDQVATEIETIEQQIADIDGQLRNSAAAKELQARREALERNLARARKREEEAQDEVIKWLGDNGRFLVSTRITEQTFDHLKSEETKGRIPSPYNEEFVKDLLDMKKCICGAELKEGTDAYSNVEKLLNRAANHTLRSRLTSIRARLEQLKSGRAQAPAKLSGANKRLAEARQEISEFEARQAEISGKLQNIDFGEIAQREKKRNELIQSANQKRTQIGVFSNQITIAEEEKATAQRDLKRLAETDAESRIFVSRFSLCEQLRDRLDKELEEEEESARGVLRKSIGRILDETSRKNFRLRMTSEYGISLENDAGTQLPKSGGENQLLGLAFTAALVEFAKTRQNASDFRLLKGTVAPLVLDSPFGQLDESYRKTTARYVPTMASQVVLMISGSQGAGGVIDALKNRIGREYVLVRHNRDPRGARQREIRQFHGKDYELTHFDSGYDGTTIEEVAS